MRVRVAVLLDQVRRLSSEEREEFEAAVLREVELRRNAAGAGGTPEPELGRRAGEADGGENLVDGDVVFAGRCPENGGSGREGALLRSYGGVGGVDGLISIDDLLFDEDYPEPVDVAIMAALGVLLEEAEAEPLTLERKAEILERGRTASKGNRGAFWSFANMLDDIDPELPSMSPVCVVGEGGG